ncbi:MAG: UTP--glucose-1-phosphate uridylyltransferase [Holosporales bacterium]
MIRKAIFPVAGLGTRFLPATKASPKEMLVVVDKPLIQYAVEEAYEAGIREMIFVTGRSKRAIEDHFDMAYELEAELAIKEKKEMLDLLDKIKPKDMECIYIRQSKALGLGHAVYCARSIINQDPFAVLLADDLLLAEKPILKQMVELFNEYKSSVIAVQNVPLEETKKYGILDGHFLNDRVIDIQSIVEKPHPDDAPTTLAVSGRYVFTSKIFDHIHTNQKGTHGEIQLTDGISSLIQEEKVLGFQYDGYRFDCGSKLGLLQANVYMGLKDPQISEDFKVWLGQNYKAS